MDKPVIIIFVFAAIVLVSLVIFLLVLSGQTARSRPPIKHSDRRVKSKYRTTQHDLDRTMYPPSLRGNRRP